MFLLIVSEIGEQSTLHFTVNNSNPNIYFKFSWRDYSYDSQRFTQWDIYECVLWVIINSEFIFEQLAKTKFIAYSDGTNWMTSEPLKSPKQIIYLNSFYPEFVCRTSFYPLVNLFHNN